MSNQGRSLGCASAQGDMTTGGAVQPTQHTFMAIESTFAGHTAPLPLAVYSVTGRKPVGLGEGGTSIG